MKKIVILIVATVAILGAIFAYIMINRSAKGLSETERNAYLTKLLGRKLNLTGKTTQKEYTTYNGKYVSFIYPKDAQPFDDQNKPGAPYYAKNSLDGFVFSLGNPFLWGSVQVVPNTSGTDRLEDYSGIRVRLLDPNTYKESPVVVGGNKGLLFDKFDVSSGTEKIAFFLVNNRIYTVYVQGNSKEDLETLFNKMLTSLKIY